MGGAICLRDSLFSCDADDKKDEKLFLLIILSRFLDRLLILLSTASVAYVAEVGGSKPCETSLLE